MTTLQTTKFSFADHTASVDASKVNSDLQNLAHALQYVNSGRNELIANYEKRLKEFADHETKITALAIEIEGGKIATYDEVHTLHEKSRRISPSI